jgi:hypothetical protein
MGSFCQTSLKQKISCKCTFKKATESDFKLRSVPLNPAVSATENDREYGKKLLIINLFLTALEYVDESKRTFVGNIGLAIFLTIRYFIHKSGTFAYQ